MTDTEKLLLVGGLGAMLLLRSRPAQPSGRLPQNTQTNQPVQTQGANPTQAPDGSGLGGLGGLLGGLAGLGGSLVKAFGGSGYDTSTNQTSDPSGGDVGQGYDPGQIDQGATTDVNGVSEYGDGVSGGDGGVWGWGGGGQSAQDMGWDAGVD